MKWNFGRKISKFRRIFRYLRGYSAISTEELLKFLDSDTDAPLPYAASPGANIILSYTKNVALGMTTLKATH